MKRQYQKPNIWIESFIMDTSIADNCTVSMDDYLNEAWQEAARAGMTWEEFYDMFLQSQGSDGDCYYTAAASAYAVSS